MQEHPNCLYTRRAAILVAKYTVQKKGRFQSSHDGAIISLLTACEVNAHQEGYTVITYDNVMAQAKHYGYEEEWHE